jgi:glycopeptide antibiotics resistance protein
MKMYLLLMLSVRGAAAFIAAAHKSPKKPLIYIIDIIYLAVMIYMVGFRGVRTGLGGINIRFPLPFLEAIISRHYGVTTNRSMLNMILFVPFGYLFAKTIQHASWKNIRWWVAAGAGFAVSLLIETAQLLFRFGVFELDDLIKNTLGAWGGYLIWTQLEHWEPNRELQ